MAEMLPRPPASPGELLPTTPASPSPGVVQAFATVLTKPAEFFESIRAQTGFGAPIVFALVMGLFAGVLSAVIQALGLGAAGGPGGRAGVGMAIAGIVLSPTIAVAVGSFVGGAIVHVIALVANGKGTYEQSVRIASYSLAVLPIGALLAVSPFLPTLANLYGLWIVVAGVIAIHLGDRKRTFVAAAVLAVAVVVVGIAGALLARGGDDATASLQGRFGAGSDFQRDVEKARDEMRRATEEMQRAAERANREPPERANDDSPP